MQFDVVKAIEAEVKCIAVLSISVPYTDGAVWCSVVCIDAAVKCGVGACRINYDVRR
jgi:hypothetical protein